jgi:hypothetical protein
VSLEKDQRLIAEYVEWSARMKTMAHDVTPERFTIERAKQEAFERVEAAISYLELYSDRWQEDDANIYKLLTGEDA